MKRSEMIKIIEGHLILGKNFSEDTHKTAEHIFESCYPTVLETSPPPKLRSDFGYGGERQMNRIRKERESYEKK